MNRSEARRQRPWWQRLDGAPPAKPVPSTAFRLVHPWLFSAVIASLVTVPGLVLGLVYFDAELSGLLRFVLPVFLIWFVGGGMRLRRSTQL